MVKTFLILCFILFGLEQVEAQLRMDKAEAMGAMNSLVFTDQTKTVKEGEYEFIHYLNTKLNQETILRINKKGTCDQLITVMPMSEWENYVKIFSGKNSNVSSDKHTWTSSGKNMWKKNDGTTTSTLVPHDNKNYFSLVLATPEARK